MSASNTVKHAPGLEKHPDYRLELVKSEQSIRVQWDDVVLAQSNECLALMEADYPTVYYFPRKHVCLELMQTSEHKTYCPFKGYANYWSVSRRPATGTSNSMQALQNVAWSYETPYDEVADLKGYIAFYQDRVDIRILDNS